ncbi:MAG: hypothetical protein HOE90_10830 [Bacteriovoracaceae bacterium]|jgi:exopolyphosphatase / guanosine-5'-triphosphate,3'-diphosphate pyrophosphatase|nr:hypothetical protein [Bacteriovoracaceae bacterium]
MLLWPFKKKKRIFAAIDLGSNAVRLVIVRYLKDGTYFLLDKVRFPLRLGLDVFNTGKISEETLTKSAETFVQFSNIIDFYNVSEIMAVGTSALREAENSKEFVDLITEKSGICINTISGDREAELISSAVFNVVDLSRGCSLMIDIGGGSVELSFVDKGEVLMRESYPMGTIRTLEHLKNRSKKEVLKEYKELITPFLKKASKAGKIKRILGTGGNIERFASLTGDTNHTGLGVISGKKLAQLKVQFEELGTSGIMKEFGFTADRSDVAFPAALVLNLVVEQSQGDEILVPFVGLRDGLIFSIIGKFRDEKRENELNKFNTRLGKIKDKFGKIETGVNQNLLKAQFIKHPNTPLHGRAFIDISKIYENPQTFRLTTKDLAMAVIETGANKIIGIDASGFIPAAAIAQYLEFGLVLARKGSRLPGEKVTTHFKADDKKNSLEIGASSLGEFDRVFIVDDIVSTGKSAVACFELVKKSGAKVVGMGFIVEYSKNNMREKVEDVPVISLVKLDSP